MVRSVSSRPGAGPKGGARGDGALHGAAGEVKRVEDGDIAEPLGRRGVGEQQSEEDEDGGDDEAAIEGGRGDVVVLQPPAVPAALDEEVEEGANDAPAAGLRRF